MRINPTKSAFAVALCIAVVLGQTSTAALADSCDEYAKQAVAEATEAIKLGCAATDKAVPGVFSGPRWSTNLADHENWCRSEGVKAVRGSISAAQDEEAIRKFSLDGCRVCDDYAAKAIKQSRLAAQLHCGFTGAEWGTSRSVQMTACFDHGAIFGAEDVITAREDQLNYCRTHVRSRVTSRPPNLNLRTPSAASGRAASPCANSDCSVPSQGSSQSSSSKIVQPGLLEGDSGFVQQGPAAAGSPGRGSPGGATGVVVKSRSY